ncbi:MAG: EpsG family protein [Clostridia bacterium]|nr:EpsG family protein [Clostridia bacterium]
MFYLVILFVLCATAIMIDIGMAKPGIPDSSRDQKWLNFATVCLLIYIAGFRNMGGSDFSIYATIYANSPDLKDFFEDYAYLHDHYFLLGIDKGYVFINSLMKTIGFTYFGYNFIHSCVCFLLVYFGTRKYTNNFSIVIMVLLYKMFFYDFFISLRQTITIAVFLSMLGDIEKKHPVRYFLLCIFCYWIHAASIVLFVVYFVRYLKLSQKTIILLNVIFIPTLLLSILNVPVLKIFDTILDWDIFGSDVIAEKAAGLLQGDVETGINWLHTIEYFGMMFLLTLTFDDIKETFPQSDMMIKLFLCLLPIFTLFRNYEILTRWKDYFTISYGFLFSYLAGIQNRRYRRAVMYFVILWVGIGFFRYINVFDEGIFRSYFPVRGMVDLYKRPF